MILEQLDILFALNKLGIKCKLEGNKIALNQLVLVCANIAMLILIYSFLAFRVMACGLHSSENIPVGKQGAHRGAECFCLSKSAWNHTETQGTESKASYPCQWTFLKSFGLFFLFPACLISPVFTDHLRPPSLSENLWCILPSMPLTSFSRLSMQRKSIRKDTAQQEGLPKSLKLLFVSLWRSQQRTWDLLWATREGELAIG